MDQEKGSPAPIQKSPYHPTLIPGTSFPQAIEMILQHAVLHAQRMGHRSDIAVFDVPRPKEVNEYPARIGR
jgi:hypothetical protein